MYRLSSIIICLLLAGTSLAQSPHGEPFKMNCAACHSNDSWEIPLSTWTAGEASSSADSIRFNHNQTAFPLEGGHAATDCRLCHQALEFTATPTECISCHTDMHNMTAGNDCARCHSVDNWLVDNITELHQDEGFPLLGAHALTTCTDCHTSESGLQFNRLGNDCINCHQEDYVATTEPNHIELGYSTNCIDCHDINAFDWSADNILHDFFPLVQGHDISCNECHTTGVYEAIPKDCFTCHEMDYEAALNPNHQQLNFGTDCAACHTLEPDWMPAQFLEHDNLYFPIYSGEHQGEWQECQECHPNPGDYAVFSCTTCHEKNETDGEHDDVGGYVYESGACLACHPNGDGEGTFDHNKTRFPLTGAHIAVDCAACHTNGYKGTPTDCAACHQTDFEQTTKPDHQLLSFSTDCASCHTTDPDWMPATFADHDKFYPLRGAHATIANNCAACHNETFTNTPTECIGCHQADYDNANDPNHATAGFSTNCLECHNETAWEPADFDHDGKYFPIYSGNHNNEWTKCTECHTTAGNFALFSCIDCHEHNNQNDLADDHEDVNGYKFESTACFECHPRGD